MKYFLYIVLIMIVLVIGINIGSTNDINKAENIQNQINEFESDIKNNNDTKRYNIEPNLFNKLADKCNKGLENLVDKILEKIVE